MKFKKEDRSEIFRDEISKILSDNLFFRGIKITQERICDYVLHNWGNKKLKKAIDEYTCGMNKQLAVLKELEENQREQEKLLREMIEIIKKMIEVVKNGGYRKKEE